MASAFELPANQHHPEVGYYRKRRKRVGYEAGTDFYTSSTSGAVFGQLVAAACAKLLRAAGRDPAAHTFVEIGAEPFDSAQGRPGSEGVLTGVQHPFAAIRTVRVNEPLAALTGDCVVFSNELFDAQPCTRHVFRQGRWWELGVRLEEGRLIQVELESSAKWPGQEGYHLDQPIAAVELTERIAQQSWTGLFVAFDYGKSLRELTEACPSGTMRAYRRHTQSNKLLDHPGEQDLTCHVCWDWLSDALSRHGFASPRLDSQEAFFLNNATEFIAATCAAEALRASRRKLSLMQLLHPSHLGQKFQVLHAMR